jgi:ABC-type Fe3+ transport system permease subunit
MGGIATIFGDLPMNANKHYVALVEVLLILPAALFMASLVIRELPASDLNLAAQRTVMWYAERQWTLWLLLVTLPLVVLVVGCTTLLQGWDADRLRTAAHRPLAVISTDGTSIFIAALTFASAIILAIVGLHILAN